MSGRTLEKLKSRAADAGLSLTAVTPVLERFVEVSRRYAALEKLALGSVSLTFPAHLFTDRPAPDADPLVAGLTLAARERERLDLGRGAVDDLLAVIEAQGLKVVGVAIPIEVPLLGAFVFDQEFGPALLVGTGPGPERDYAMAHEYGHFLADYDPYTPWICLKGKGAADSPGELRAHAFAGGFLVPGEDLDLYLRASNVRKGDPMSADLLRQLRAYFEADDRAIVGRLLAGGWLRREEIGPLMRTLREDPEPDAGPPGRPLSARFVSLAVMAVRSGRLNMKEMAEHLDVDERTARRIEGSFRIDEEERETRVDRQG